MYTFDDLAAAANEEALHAGPLGARPLARDVVCFVGDPVVLVVAESRALAEDACELVNIEYEPHPAVIDLWTAVDNDNELVHEELDSNVARTTTSPDDPELGAAFDAAAHVVTETIRQHRYIAVPMETRGVGRELGSRPGRHDDLDLEPGGAQRAGSLRPLPRPSRREGARHRARRRRRVRPEDQRRA